MCFRIVITSFPDVNYGNKGDITAQELFQVLPKSRKAPTLLLYIKYNKNAIFVIELKYN